MTFDDFIFACVFIFAMIHSFFTLKYFRFLMKSKLILGGVTIIHMLTFFYFFMLLYE